MLDSVTAAPARVDLKFHGRPGHQTIVSPPALGRLLPRYQPGSSMAASGQKAAVRKCLLCAAYRPYSSASQSPESGHGRGSRKRSDQRPKKNQTSPFGLISGIAFNVTTRHAVETAQRMTFKTIDPDTRDPRDNHDTQGLPLYSSEPASRLVNHSWQGRRLSRDKLRSVRSGSRSRYHGRHHPPCRTQKLSLTSNWRICRDGVELYFKSCRCRILAKPGHFGFRNYSSKAGFFGRVPALGHNTANNRQRQQHGLRLICHRLK